MSLPYDIQMIVIDHLAKDTDTLRQCALISRGWIPVVRQYLFCEATLFFDDRPDRSAKVQDRIAFLCQPQNNIVTHIQYLVIQAFHLITFVEIECLKHLPEMPNLRALELNALRFDSLLQSDRSSTAAVLHQIIRRYNIDTLKFIGGKYDLEQVIELISIPKNLQELSITSAFESNSDPRIYDRFTYSGDRLPLLKLDANKVGDIGRWIPSKCLLQTLEVTLDDETSLIPLSIMLTHEHNLRHLVLEYMWASLPDDYVGLFSETLETLELRHTSYGYQGWMTPLLRGARLPELSRLIITLQSEEIGALNSMLVQDIAGVIVGCGLGQENMTVTFSYVVSGYDTQELRARKVAILQRTAIAAFTDHGLSSRLLWV